MISRIFASAAAGAAMFAAASLSSPSAAAPVSEPGQAASDIVALANGLNLKSHAFFQLGEPTGGLKGYEELCQGRPDYCETGKGDNFTFVVLDEETRRDIFKINLMANAAIWPKSDDDNYKTSEHWQRPDFIEGKGQFGDCEDYVLMKLEELQKIGIPRDAMSIVHVETPWKEPHAVLSLRTDKGDLVLDNLSEEILLPNETGHTPVQMEAAGGWRAASLSDDPAGPLGEAAAPDPLGELIRQVTPNVPIPTPRPER